MPPPAALDDVGHPGTGYRRHPELESALKLELGRDFVKNDDNPEDELRRPGTWRSMTPDTGVHLECDASPKGAQGR